MKTLCQNCKKRDTCSVLCREAGQFVAQDHVSQKEKTIGTPLYGPKIEEIDDQNSLTFRERQIFSLWNGGLNRSDICKTLKITRKTLRVHVFNIGKKTSVHVKISD